MAGRGGTGSPSVTSPGGGRKGTKPEGGHNLPPTFFRKGLAVWVPDPFPPNETEHYAAIREQSGRPPYTAARVRDNNGRDEVIVEWGTGSKRIKMKEIWPMNDVQGNDCELYTPEEV